MGVHEVGRGSCWERGCQWEVGRLGGSEVRRFGGWQVGRLVGWARGAVRGAVPARHANREREAFSIKALQCSPALLPPAGLFYT